MINVIFITIYFYNINYIHVAKWVHNKLYLNTIISLKRNIKNSRYLDGTFKILNEASTALNSNRIIYAFILVCNK